MKTVVSLFDGISCCYMALKKAGIHFDKYIASEVDKYAQKASLYNFSDIIRVGDVRNVKINEPVWLLAGGSPCQSFSFAGKMNGMSYKQKKEYVYSYEEHKIHELAFGWIDKDDFIEKRNLEINKETKTVLDVISLAHYIDLKEKGFEFEGQSYLFWEYVRILKETKPKYFFLENVEMPEKWEKLISKTLGLNPIKINSSLVSAQNRVRLYWTNIGLEPNGLFGDLQSIIPQPKDKGIFIKDILQDQVDEKYFIKGKELEFATSVEKLGKFTQIDGDKSKCLTARMYASWNAGYISEPTTESGGKQPFQQNRIYDANAKAPCLMHNLTKGSNMIYSDYAIRRFTPVEVCRLQTIPDNFFFDENGNNIISDSQIYKAVGNGWTVDVIAHIFNYLQP